MVAHVRNARLIAAFERVPRESFLGSGPWQIPTGVTDGTVTYRTTPDDNPRHIYQDVLVAIDPARGLNNGQPSGLAGWFDALDLCENETVVHIGCGTGYYSAILAEVVGLRGRVIAIEGDEALAHRAQYHLRSYTQVEVVHGNGAFVCPGAADVVFVNAGVTDPRRIWLDALRPRGRLLIPVTAGTGRGEAGLGTMFLVDRRSQGFAARRLSNVGIFHCAGARDEALNLEVARLGSATAADVRSVRCDDHEPDGSCWLHGRECCLSRLEC